MTARKKNRVRGIYFLPNLFTMAALFSGFYAIIAAMKGMYHTAAIAIFIALIFDGLDGRVARLMNATSEFGAQLDSLSDMACFGVGPALILYFWSLHALQKLGWLVAFIYVVCTALRLARFNTQLNDKEHKKHSQGLTTTMAAGFMASLVWVSSKYDIDATASYLPYAVACITFVVSLLKVSNVRFNTFKDIDMRGKVSFLTTLLIVFLILIIAFDPADIIFILLLCYIISGPCITAISIGRKRRKRRQRQHA